MESSTASKVNVALTLRAPTDTICIFSCVREDTFEEDMMAVHATKPFGLGTVDALIRFNASDDLGLGQAKRIVSCNMCVGPSSVPESLLARASPTTSLVSRKNLQVTARANRSFCWTFSSRIFCHISGGRRLKRFSFLAFSFSHKLNNSFFARAFPFPFALLSSNKRTTSSFLRTRGSSSSLASSTLARFAEEVDSAPRATIPSTRRRRLGAITRPDHDRSPLWPPPRSPAGRGCPSALLPLSPPPPLAIANLARVSPDRFSKNFSKFKLVHRVDETVH